MATTVINRYYIIKVKLNDWQELDGIEYTEREANIMLRRLKSGGCRYPLRKQFIREQQDQILTARVNQ